MSVTTINGVELHHDDLGTGDDVIVWGHGFLFAAELYHDLIARLPGYRHIAVDFRGHGRSASVTSGCTLAQMAEDVHELTCGLGIDRYTYIGHSMGNGIGMRLAARHSDRVRAAISMAGLPAAGLPQTSRALPDALVTMQGDSEQLAAALGQTFVHDGMDALIKTSGRCAALLHPGPLREIADTELFRDEADQIIPGLVQPWLFLIPGEDVAVPPDAQLATARAVPGARAIWFNGEGHIFPQERPDEVATVIRTFLDNLPRT